VELLSYKGRAVDALASEGDEGRGKLRKVAGSCKQALIRKCPNGVTPLIEDKRLSPESIGCVEQTRRSETSQ